MGCQIHGSCNRGCAPCVFFETHCLRQDIRVPFDLMAQDPRTEDPRKQDLKDFAKAGTLGPLLTGQKTV